MFLARTLGGIEPAERVRLRKQDVGANIGVADGPKGERQGRKLLLHFRHSRHPWRSDGASNPAVHGWTNAASAGCAGAAVTQAVYRRRRPCCSQKFELPTATPPSPSRIGKMHRQQQRRGMEDGQGLDRRIPFGEPCCAVRQVPCLTWPRNNAPASRSTSS